MLAPIHPTEQELISNILLAQNQEEVKQKVDFFMELLNELGTGENEIKRILNNIQAQLDSCNPFNFDAQQWSNIKMADIYCYEIYQAMFGVQYL
ncbi:hypothetical protein [Hydrotalea sp.]|uniref:hypothetical protein n=1 Tax=Hydrotalea sp. TaxID=2881279 RepID=UPI003D101E70